MSRRALLIIALVAVLARLSFEVGLHGDRLHGGAAGTLAAYLLGDERAYDGFARKVSAGTLQRERAFYQEPLYAWTLGQLYKVFPPPPIEPDVAVVPKAPVHEAVILVQHVLGVIMAVLVALLGWRCFGRAGGWLAGLFAALSGPTIFAESMLLKESVALLLWVVALHLWLDVLQDRGGRPRALLLGALLGLLTLLRGNSYILLAFVLASLLLRLPDLRHAGPQPAGPQPASPQPTGRRRIGAAALVLVATLAAIAPATVQNLRRGDFVLTTYQAGSNAAIGQPDNDVPWRGIAYEPIHAGRGDAAYEEQDAVAVVEAAEGRRLTGREVSAWWWHETLRRVAAHPLAAGERVGLKLLHTFHGDEVPDVKDWAFFKLALPWLARPISDLTWLGPLALLGFLLLPWRERDAEGRPGALRRDLLVVRGSVAVIALSLALFYVMGRYRLPAAPGLWVLAAGVLVEVGRRALIVLRAPGAAEPRRKMGFVATFLLGAAVVAAGQVTIRLDAGGLQVSWANLASVELALARTAGTEADAVHHRDAAVAASQRALQIAPGFPEARATLIYALDLRTPLVEPRAAEAWDQAWRLLFVMEAERTRDGGVDPSVLQQPLASVQDAALRLRALPTLPGRELYVTDALALACRRVAQDIRQADGLPLALDLVDEALRCKPDDGEALVQRGLILKRLGRSDEAEQAYRAALAQGVDTVELHNNLGNLLLSGGRADEALLQFERALELDPGNETVRQNVERARAAPRAEPGTEQGAPAGG